MTPDSLLVTRDHGEAAPHRLSLMRSEDNLGVYLNSNGRCLYFDNDMWQELEAMMSSFRVTGVRKMLNYEEQLPVRTPIHANIPSKASLEDLA